MLTTSSIEVPTTCRIAELADQVTCPTVYTVCIKARKDHSSSDVCSKIVWNLRRNSGTETNVILDEPVGYTPGALGGVDLAELAVGVVARLHEAGGGVSALEVGDQGTYVRGTETSVAAEVPRGRRVARLARAEDHAA